MPKEATHRIRTNNALVNYGVSESSYDKLQSFVDLLFFVCEFNV